MRWMRRTLRLTGEDLEARARDLIAQLATGRATMDASDLAYHRAEFYRALQHLDLERAQPLSLRYEAFAASPAATLERCPRCEGPLATVRSGRRLSDGRLRLNVICTASCGWGWEHIPPARACPDCGEAPAADDAVWCVTCGGRLPVVGATTRL